MDADKTSNTNRPNKMLQNKTICTSPPSPPPYLFWSDIEEFESWLSLVQRTVHIVGLTVVEVTRQVGCRNLQTGNIKKNVRAFYSTVADQSGSHTADTIFTASKISVPPPSSVNYFRWPLGYFYQKPVFMSISMFWRERERSHREHTYVSMGEFVCCWRRGK